jgi:cell division control protein 11
MDIELMRRLSPRVNVIPVIGKADSLAPSELKAFKKRVMEDIEHYGIPVYNFPYDVEEDDEETIIITVNSGLFSPSRSLAPRRKLRLRDSSSVRGSTHGVLLKSTTPSIPTLVVLGAHS